MVYIFLADGFEEVEALTQADFLRRAKIDVCTVGVGGKYVTGAHGITVRADISDLDAMKVICETEMIVLPGGMPGTKNLDASKAVHAFIDHCVQKKLYIAAICAAPSILGRLGLLDGKNAVCYPGFENELRGATVADCQCVRDGNIICARGPGAAAQFALEIISTLKGEAAADEVRRAIII